MFWDGEKWVPQGRPTPAPIRRNRLRDWFATVPIVLLVPALVLPLAVTQAAPSPDKQADRLASASPVEREVEPVIDLDGRMAPGTTFRIRGSSFAPLTSAAILWDQDSVLAKLGSGAPARSPRVRTFRRAPSPASTPSP